MQIHAYPDPGKTFSSQKNEKYTFKQCFGWIRINFGPRRAQMTLKNRKKEINFKF
jgi:hypothetical protein